MDVHGKVRLLPLFSQRQVKLQEMKYTIGQEIEYIVLNDPRAFINLITTPDETSVSLKASGIFRTSYYQKTKQNKNIYCHI